MNLRETKFQIWRRRSNERLWRFGVIPVFILCVLFQLSIVPIVTLLSAFLGNIDIETNRLWAQLGRAAIMGIGMALLLWKFRQDQRNEANQTGKLANV